MLNRQDFLFKREAEGAIKYLVPQYASKAEAKRDEKGWWLNVWWHCGEVSPLTVQEMSQALGER